MPLVVFCHNLCADENGEMAGQGHGMDSAGAL